MTLDNQGLKKKRVNKYMQICICTVRLDHKISIQNRLPFDRIATYVQIPFKLPFSV